MSSPTKLEITSETAAGGRRPEKKARLTQQIATVAGELFRAHGYVAVTMEQIAAAADVSKRTLYKYFPVKEALLAHLLEGELARDLANPGFRFDVEAPFRSNVTALLAESAAWCERHPNYLLPYIRYKFIVFRPDEESGADGGDMVHAWKQLIVAGQQSGELDASRPADELAFYFHYLYLAALMRWITDRRHDLRQEFAKVVGLFLDGAIRPPTSTR